MGEGCLKGKNSKSLQIHIKFTKQNLGKNVEMFGTIYTYLNIEFIYQNGCTFAYISLLTFDMLI